MTEGLRSDLPRDAALNRIRVIIALALTYAVLGILMNSVGVVILQSIRHFDATKPMGSTLEACKDLSVVAASFLLATRVPAFGYRRALIGVMEKYRQVDGSIVGREVLRAYMGGADRIA